MEECPICYECTHDVKAIPHVDPQGDVSGHRMCEKCRKHWGTECPFCRDVTTKDELVQFIGDFVSTVNATTFAPTGGCTVAERNDLRDDRAEVLQKWESFEMQYEGNPRVVRSVAKLLAEDSSFSQLLESALMTKAEWLPETAGIIFRLHGMSKDGELQRLQARHHENIEKAVEQILEPYEAKQWRLNGTFYGALYMQAIVAFLCAQRACGSCFTLRKTVQRIGKAMISRYHAENMSELFKMRSLENLHVQYLQLIHIPVWGSIDDDIVWQAFCSRPARIPQKQLPQEHIRPWLLVILFAFVLRFLYRRFVPTSGG